MSANSASRTATTRGGCSSNLGVRRIQTLLKYKNNKTNVNDATVPQQATFNAPLKQCHVLPPDRWLWDQRRVLSVGWVGLYVVVPACVTYENQWQCVGHGFRWQLWRSIGWRWCYPLLGSLALRTFSSLNGYFPTMK